MAQVEMICGPYRVVSLMSTDAADEPASNRACVPSPVVKSTNVVVEVPEVRRLAGPGSCCSPSPRAGVATTARQTAAEVAASSPCSPPPR